jgi:hypothetical protein
MMEEFRDRKDMSNPIHAANGEQQPSLASDQIEIILRALENPAYDWRTVRGLARETAMPEEQVEKILTENGDLLVHTTDEDGRSLFTTRNYYDTRHSLGRRFLSAIADIIK